MKKVFTLFVLFCLLSCQKEEVFNSTEITETNDECDLYSYLKNRNIQLSNAATPYIYFPNLEEGWDYAMTLEQRLQYARLQVRPLLTYEYQNLKKAFPNVRFNNIVVKIPYPGTYFNCFAFAIGVHKWINVYSLTELDHLYANARKLFGAQNNYYNSGSFENYSPIAYGNGRTPKHAAKMVEGRNWIESKMGGDFILIHTENALMGGIYGNYIIAVYQKELNRSIDVSDKEYIKSIHESVQENIYFSDNEKKIIVDRAKKISLKYPQFDSIYEQWKNAFFRSFSSHTSTSKNLPQYPILLKMGKDIIPLLIEKMISNEDDFIALELYNDLQKNDNLKLIYDRNDPRILEGMQQTAKKTVKKWLQSNM